MHPLCGAWRTLCVGHGKRRPRGKTVNLESGPGTAAAIDTHPRRTLLPVLAVHMQKNIHGQSRFSRHAFRIANSIGVNAMTTTDKEQRLDGVMVELAGKAEVRHRECVGFGEAVTGDCPSPMQPNRDEYKDGKGPCCRCIPHERLRRLWQGDCMDGMRPMTRTGRSCTRSCAALAATH